MIIYTGIGKFIDKNINDDELNKMITRQFKDSKSYRMKKDGNCLSSVKIIFANSSDLEKAKKDGLFINHMHCPVFEFVTNSSPEPTRCFKCQKFHKSVAKICTHDVACGHCSGPHSLSDCEHKNDPNKMKCINCNEKHKSNDKNCPVYLKIKDKMMSSRIDISNNGG